MRQSARIIPGISIIVLLLSLIGSGQEIGEKQKELTTIKKEIEQQRKKIRETGREEKSILTQLSEMDRRLSSKEKELASIIHDIDAANDDITRLEARIVELGDKLDLKQKDINKRLVSLYKLGGTGYLPVLFYAKGTDDLKRTAKYLSSVIYSDRAVFAAFVQDRDALEENVRELKERRNTLILLKDSADTKTLDIIGEKDRRTAYLADIRQEKSFYEQALTELQAAERELASLVERLRIEQEKKEREQKEKEKAQKKTPTKGNASAPSGGYFAGLKGMLPYPASGAVITKYGKGKDPKYDNPIYNKGIEIQAPQSSPIVAVADGSVIYADYFAGYGNLIIIDHGDNYYTVYAHAKDILRKVGDTVKAREKIGTVGDTGSLKGPTLYFEIRHHGDTTDPEKWLAKG